MGVNLSTMSRRGKYLSASHARRCNRVSIELYLFSNEMENIDKIQGERNGQESRLCKGNVLAPLTSVVLNGNHFDCSLHEWVLLSRDYLRKRKMV